MANDILTLLLDPQPKPAGGGGGKGRNTIKFDRLERQKNALAAEVRMLSQDLTPRPQFSGMVHLVANMFPDSLAPTHIPSDLFSRDNGFSIVAPLGTGYLVEGPINAFSRLADRIENPSSLAVQSDISRVLSIDFHDTDYALQGLGLQQLWDAAVTRGDTRLFFLWLTPFQNTAARQSLISSLDQQRLNQVFLPAPPTRTTLIGAGTRAVVPVTGEQRYTQAVQKYTSQGNSIIPVQIESVEKLSALVASGTVIRVDPVRRLSVAAPGTGREPTPPFDLSNEPVVAVIDGGRSAPSYNHAEAWRANPPFVSDHVADLTHGNAITSLVVNGYAWNNNRSLPDLLCRVGVVQAVPRPSVAIEWDEYELIEYLAAVARDFPDTSVWNISANYEGLGTSKVSVLGHLINALARSYNILPVVSIGNVSDTGNDLLAPPADCDAALVVGGRLANSDGKPGESCPVCCKGPGPDSMQKPDISSFSQLRVLGGNTVTGSSYATAVTSPLVAHTRSKLREPDSDLTKALLIHMTECGFHDPRIGWGSPFHGHLPWECPDGNVTMAFRASLSPGNAYYLEIPIPPGLVQDNKLVGGFKLTAVLNPLVSSAGTGNYYASRLETNLQYLNAKDKYSPILGSPEEGSTAERKARTEFSKWSPVRHYPMKYFPRGRVFSGNTLRLYARVFVRDKYQFGWTTNDEIPEQTAAFALTFQSSEKSPDFYDSTYGALRNIVDTAIVQDIDIRVGS